MAIKQTIPFEVDLRDATETQSLPNLLIEGDENAYEIEVSVYRDGVPVDMTGADVYGYGMVGSTTAVSIGHAVGNKAWFDITGDFCLKQGTITIDMNVQYGETVYTVFRCQGRVQKSAYGNPISGEVHQIDWENAYLAALNEPLRVEAEEARVSAEEARQATIAKAETAATNAEEMARIAVQATSDLQGLKDATNMAAQKALDSSEAADDAAGKALTAKAGADEAALAARSAADTAIEVANTAAGAAVETAQSAAEIATAAAENATASAAAAVTAADAARDRANAAAAETEAVIDDTLSAKNAAISATENANIAANSANTAAGRVDTAIATANTAAENANNAAQSTAIVRDEAILATGNANTAADRANAAAESAEQRVYVLPSATADRLGGIKVGRNITVANDGTLDADVSAEDINVLTGDIEAIEGDISGIDSTLTTHTGDGSIHVTAADKTAWNAKPTQDDLSAHTGNGDIHFSADERTKLSGIAAGANAYTHPSHTAASSGLYKVTVDSQGHVTAATAVQKSDITALGIPGSDTNTTYSAATQSAAGLMSAADKTKLDGVATGANAYSHPTSSGNKHIPSGGSSGQILRWSADGTAAWGADNNTTYSAATQSAAGLMSAADKTKLDGVATQANKYTHPSYTAKSSGLYKVTVDATGHVSAATAVAKADITGLGIPGSDTNTTYSAGTNMSLSGTTFSANVVATASVSIAAADWNSSNQVTKSISWSGWTAANTSHVIASVNFSGVTAANMKILAKSLIAMTTFSGTSAVFTAAGGKPSIACTVNLMALR